MTTYKYSNPESPYVAIIDDDGVCRSSCLASVLPPDAVIEPYIPPIPTPAELLQKLDADNALTQRNLRETVMLMAEAFKTITNGAVDLSTIPGVAKVFTVEAEAATIRSQL